MTSPFESEVSLNLEKLTSRLVAISRVGKYIHSSLVASRGKIGLTLMLTLIAVFDFETRLFGLFPLRSLTCTSDLATTELSK